MDVALITANQWFLRGHLQKRYADSKDNKVLQSWLRDNFSADSVGGKIFLPEDQLLRDALASRGLDAHIVAWDNPEVVWSKVKLCVVRSPSDWAFRLREFLAWAENVQRVTTIWNSAELMKWVANKSYLLQLQERGINVVPTHTCPRGESVDLVSLLERMGWDEVIIKPMVGQGAFGVIRTSLTPSAECFSIAEAQVHLNALLQRHGAIIQPFFHSVKIEGEISLIYIQGRVTHAIRKYPNAGDFRAYGAPMSRQELIPVDQDLAEFAHRAILAAGMPIQFGRVDVIAGHRDEKTLLELELLQPRLFLALSSEALDLAANAICAAVVA